MTALRLLKVAAGATALLAIVTACAATKQGGGGGSQAQAAPAPAPAPAASQPAAAQPAAAPAEPTRPAEPVKKVAILEIVPKAGFDRDRSELFNEFLQSELRSRGHTVIGKSDIEAMLGLQKLKDVLACDNSSCYAEIGGALGVDELVTGAIGKLDPYLLITLKRLSPNEGRVLKQATEKIADAGDKQLVDSIPRLISQLYGGSAQRASGDSAPEPAPAIAASASPAQSDPAAGFDRQNFSSSDNQDIAYISQGVQFMVTDQNDTYVVAVETGHASFQCSQPVTFLRPCTLALPPGPAVVRVEGKDPHHIVVEPGRFNYQMQYGSMAPVWGGLGTLAAGGVILLYGLGKDCPSELNTITGELEDSSTCAGRLVPIIVGGVTGYIGVLVAAIAGPVAASIVPTVEPWGASNQNNGGGGMMFRAATILPTRNGAEATVLFEF